MKLFKHQEVARDFILYGMGLGETGLKHRGTGAIFHEMGLGKTRIALEIFMKLKEQDPALKMLVVCPLSLIEAAWGEDIKRFTDLRYKNMRKKEIIQNPDVLLINYESFMTKPEDYLIAEPQMIVLDECFSGDTLIETSNGRKRIDLIRKGDCILNCLGEDKVIGTRVKKLDSWVKIRYNNKEIKCSLNHPFLTPYGWKRARDLKKENLLISYEYSMSILQKEATKPEESLLQYILFGEMEDETARDQKKSFYKRDSKKGINRAKKMAEFRTSCCACSDRKNKKIVSHQKSEGQKKDIGGFKKNEMEARGSGRQRKAFARTAIKALETSREALANRICNYYKQKKGLSAPLQNRYSSTKIKDCNRSRRAFTYGSCEEKARSKENKIPAFYRVESVKVYKQTSDGRAGESVKKHLFYDLKVEKHPSFSVNGVLVHNSSRMKNHSSKTTKMLLKLRDRFKYRIVMSGTPAPNCELEYWAQMLFIGGPVHESFFAFRNKYFHLERGNQTMNSRFMPKEAMQRIFRQGWKYAITQRKRELLMQEISPFIDQAKKSECLDLPETTDEIRLVELGAKQQKAYTEMKRHLIIEIQGKEVTASVALAKILKLREITSGFVYNEHGQPLEINENEKK